MLKTSIWQAAPGGRCGHRAHLSAISLLAGLFLAIAPAGDAVAHDAVPTAAKPNGWSYPFACCSGFDCREVSATQISERPEGYVIEGTGEVVSHADTRLKDSPDGEYHWCSVAGKNDGKTICLFVPPRSY
jgi:hypothetical protein